MVYFNSWDKKKNTCVYIVVLRLAVLVFAENWNMSGRVMQLLQKIYIYI